MKKLFTILTILLLCANSSLADSKVKIAAIVGENVISNLDVDNRLRAVLGSQNVQLESLPEAERKAARVNILQMLINEKLFQIEGYKLSLVISDAEVNQAIKNIADQNNMTKDQFIAEIQKKDPQAEKTLTEQLRSQILWGQLQNYRIKPNLEVSNGEIDEVISHNLTKNYKITLKQIFISSKTKDEQTKGRESLAKIANKLKTCADFEQVAKKNELPSPDEITAEISNLQPEIAQVVKNLAVGKLEVLKTSAGVHALMVCQKDLPEVSVDERKKIKEMLMQHKINLKSALYVNDMRKRYYVETNLENLN